MKFILTNADGFQSAAAAGVSLVVVSFSEREVATGQIGDALDRLLHLTDDPFQSERFAGAVLVQFEGYAGDTREVFEIPEVVRFFRALTAEWAAWYHFLLREPGLQQFPMLFALLCDVEVLRVGSGIATRFRDPAQVAAVEHRLERATHALYAHHGWPEERARRTIREAQRLAFGH